MNALSYILILAQKSSGPAPLCQFPAENRPRSAPFAFSSVFQLTLHAFPFAAHPSRVFEVPFPSFDSALVFFFASSIFTDFASQLCRGLCLFRLISLAGSGIFCSSRCLCLAARSASSPSSAHLPSLHDFPSPSFLLRSVLCALLLLSLARPLRPCSQFRLCGLFWFSSSPPEFSPRALRLLYFLPCFTSSCRNKAMRLARSCSSCSVLRRASRASSSEGCRDGYAIGSLLPSQKKKFAIKNGKVELKRNKLGGVSVSRASKVLSLDELVGLRCHE